MPKRRFRRALALMLCLATLALAPAARARDDSLGDTFTLLLIGVDAYEPDAPGRSDAMILAQVTPSSGDIKLVSFLRDLYVPIADHGSTRLNAAYYYGGANLLNRTLRECFGVRGDRYIIVNFSQMADLVDQLGGVEVDVSDKELKQLNAILEYYNEQIGLDASDGLLAQSGTQLLTGKQALSYSRIRRIDSDFKRTSRQHRVLLGVLKRLAKLDLAAMLELAAKNLPDIQTDLDMGDIGAVLSLMVNAKSLRLRSVHVPFDGTYKDATKKGMMVLDANLRRNAALIQEFLELE